MKKILLAILCLSALVAFAGRTDVLSKDNGNEDDLLSMLLAMRL